MEAGWSPGHRYHCPPPLVWGTDSAPTHPSVPRPVHPHPSSPFPLPQACPVGRGPVWPWDGGQGASTRSRGGALAILGLYAQGKAGCKTGRVPGGEFQSPGLRRRAGRCRMPPTNPQPSQGGFPGLLESPVPCQMGRDLSPIFICRRWNRRAKQVWCGPCPHTPPHNLLF